jgi:uncharacterized protein YecE (DUF72 family)
MNYGAIAIRGGNCCDGQLLCRVNQAIKETRQAYVLVNNRSEGNAPLTVQAIMDQLS